MFLKININLHAFWFVSYFIYFLFIYYLFIHAICLVFWGGGGIRENREI